MLYVCACVSHCVLKLDSSLMWVIATCSGVQGPKGHSRLSVGSLSFGGRRRHLAGLSGSQLDGILVELVRATGLDSTSELIRPLRHLQVGGVYCRDAPPRGPTLDREL